MSGFGIRTGSGFAIGVHAGGMAALGPGADDPADHQGDDDGDGEEGCALAAGGHVAALGLPAGGSTEPVRHQSLMYGRARSM